MKIRYFLALSMLIMPAMTPAKAAENGYHTTDNQCFYWTGPNGLKYYSVWVGRSYLIYCGGDAKEIFQDAFARPSLPPQSEGAFVESVSGIGEGVHWDYSPFTVGP